MRLGANIRGVGGNGCNLDSATSHNSWKLKKSSSEGHRISQVVTRCQRALSGRSGKIDISAKKIIESGRAIDATSTKCRRFVGPCRRRRIPGLALGHGPHCEEGVGKRVPKLHSAG